MFLHYKNIPISINNSNLIIDDVQLSNDIELSPQYYYDSPAAESKVSSRMWNGSLKLQYYLTGKDYLKQYIFGNGLETITGNIGGLIFKQGYLSDYTLSVEPNSAVKVNAGIAFFDKLTGIFSSSKQISKTGFIFRSSDIQINNLSSYTKNITNNITKASFSYSCNLVPSYNYAGSGEYPISADRVFIQERSITSEVISDNTDLSIPLSGEEYGLIFTFSNPDNVSLNESFGCSGLISSKSLLINQNSPHKHSLKVVQNNAGRDGGISSVTQTANSITINSTADSYPFLSYDSSVNYVNEIYIGDSLVTGAVSNRYINFDRIVAPIPYDVIDGTLTMKTNQATYIWPNKLTFSYNPITISGLSANSGVYGNIIYITGKNFVRISDVIFGGQAYADFQIISPTGMSVVVPSNGQTSPITILSKDRSISGQSNTFYYPPVINSINPVVGVWKDPINIIGSNFTGTTGVYFNNTQAYSFTIPNNNLIIALSPETGKPYPSGYIKLIGSGGCAKSISYYNPYLPIYSFTPISGLPNTGITIFTKVDTGYYYPYSGGYKVRIDGIDIPFFVSSINPTGALTGYSPTDATTNNDFIYIYKKDGISSSPSTGRYQTIGFPVIDSVIPNSFSTYQNSPLTINGSNLKYFYGANSYIKVSGGINNDVQTFLPSKFTYSLDGSILVINNLIPTGSTGVYTVIVKNSAGTDVFDTAYTQIQGVNKAPGLAVSLSSLASPSSGLLYSYPLSYVKDNSYNTYSLFKCPSTYSESYYLELYSTNSNSYVSISVLNINKNISSILSNFGTTGSVTGAVVCYQNFGGGIKKPVYSGEFASIQNLSIVMLPTGIENVSNIRIIARKSLNANSYFPINEIEIY